MVMTGDEWWWTHLEKKDVCEVMRWCEKELEKIVVQHKIYNIFYPSSIYTAIQNVQNVEYSTIPKYTKHTEYTKYTKYTKYTTYSTIAFYIHCHIYMFHDFCSLVAQSLASALWCGVQITLLLVPLKSWRGGRYIQNIYKIYTEYIQLSLLVKFFLHCDFKHFAFDVSQILVRLKKKLGITGLLEKEQTGISLYLAK